ncbi:MAG TPA: tetratricopeptide repeat protein [Polyangiaceae bacterium]|nr:tetratricopeptide repeat protein [Polyangiaceae bacterium]
MKNVHNKAARLCLVLAVASASLACAGRSGKGSELPTGTKVNTPTTGGPGVVTSPEGEQYAVTDAPSSGESSNRPKMSGAAAGAHAAGLQAFQNGDLEGARTQFARASDADATAYQAHYSLGVVRERLGEVSGALTAYRKAITAVPDYEPAIVAYGVLLARTGRATEAETYLTERQSRMPKSAAVSAALAEVKSVQGDSGAAQRLAQDALKKNPDYRPAMVTLARDHYRTRRLDLALYTLRGILDGYGPENPPRDKNNAEARLLRGLIYKEQGQRGPAIDEFRKALTSRPDLVEARVQLAAYLLEAGNAPEAAQLLESALRYDKNNVLAHLNLGDAYRLLGKTSESKREFEWVAGRDPALAQVHYNLGLLYLFNENVPGMNPRTATDRAIVEFEQYKKMRPRVQGGAPDDTDELITRAKSKKALLEEQAKAPPAAASAAGATPAAAGKPGATTPAKPGTPAGTTPAKPPAGGATPPAGTTPAKPPAGGTTPPAGTTPAKPPAGGATPPAGTTPAKPPAGGATPPAGTSPAKPPAQGGTK